MLKLMPKAAPAPAPRKAPRPWLLAVLQLPIVVVLAVLLLRADPASEQPAPALKATGIRYQVRADAWPRGTSLRLLADRYGGDLAAMRALNPPGAGCANPEARIEPGDVVTIAFSSQNAECDDGGLAPSPDNSEG